MIVLDVYRLAQFPLLSTFEISLLGRQVMYGVVCKAMLLAAFVVCSDITKSACGKEEPNPMIANTRWALDYSAELGIFRWIGDAPNEDWVTRSRALRTPLMKRAIARHDEIAKELELNVRQELEIRLAVHGTVERIVASAVSHEIAVQEKTTMQVLSRAVAKLERSCLGLPFGECTVATKVARRVLTPKQLLTLEKKARVWRELDSRILYDE